MTKTLKQMETTTPISKEVLESFLLGNNTKLSEQEKALFFGMAQRNNLDPFKREIYIVKYGSNCNIITGYQTYIQRATMSGLLDGWQVENTELGAKITIYRKDFKVPFIWEVSLNDFKKASPIWKDMPDFMIKKVAIAQGFRLAFPNELGGLPYTQDELGVDEQKEQPNYKKQEPIQAVIETKKEEKKEIDVQKITPAQITKLQTLFTKLKVNKEGKEKTYSMYGVNTCKDLNKKQASELIEKMEKKLDK